MRAAASGFRVRVMDFRVRSLGCRVQGQPAEPPAAARPPARPQWMGINSGHNNDTSWLVYMKRLCAHPDS